MGRLGAVVVSAAAPLGCAIAGRLRADGIPVFLAAAEAAGGGPAERFVAAGDATTAWTGDLGLAAGVDDLVATARARVGEIGCLVVVPPLPVPEASFLDLAGDRWDAALRAVLRVAMLVSQAVAREMAAHGTRGRIVHVLPGGGWPQRAGQAPYQCALAGLVQLTRASAAELGARDILVSAVSIGVLEDAESVERGVPLARGCGLDEVAGAVAFLLGPDARFVTGSILTLDGGLGAGVSGYRPVPRG